MARGTASDGTTTAAVGGAASSWHRPPRRVSLVGLVLAASLRTRRCAFWDDLPPEYTDDLFTGDTAVVEFEPKQFDDLVLASQQVWIVDFYASWCPHCQHFAPIWKKVASDFREDTRLRFGAINCAKYQSFCGDHDVTGYPALRAYHLPGNQDSEKKEGYHVLSPEEYKEAPVTEWIRSQAALLPGVAGGGGSSAPPLAASAAAPAAAGPAPAPTAVAASPEAAAARLADAEAALQYMLRSGVPLALTRGKGGGEPALRGEALDELRGWLELLAAALPDSEARAELGRLATVAGGAGQAPQGGGEGQGPLSQDAWSQAVDGLALGRGGRPPRRGAADPSSPGAPSTQMKICATYTCGLWSLFHILTVAAAKGDQPLVTLARIRGVVMHFFGCRECAKHFGEMYDSCSFGRCTLAPGDGPGAALWLWRVHNKITARVAGEQGVEAPKPWPSITDCPSCWPYSGKGDFVHSDTSAVFSYLRSSYWRTEWSQSSQIYAVSKDNDDSLWWQVGLAIACGAVVCCIIMAFTCCVAFQLHRLARSRGDLHVASDAEAGE